MTLYRKYRPQKFSEVEGQEHIVQTLKNELASDKLAHAYIFAGPRGTGKTTIARILAKAVNCQNQTRELQRQGKVEPCNRCVSCKEIMAGKSLDLIEVDAASNRGIDEIRALRENVRFSPNKSAYKVFIIDEVHMLTREAFNALLKTLEEPPAHALFILATTEVHQVLPTILSRCQRFDFKRLNVEQIKKRLNKILKKEKRKLSDDILGIIAAKADGASRDAESFLGQILTWPKREVNLERVANFLGAVDWSLIFKFLDILLEQQREKALHTINEIVLHGYNLNDFTEKVIDCLRKMMLARVDAKLVDWGGVNFSQDDEKNLLALAEKVSLKDLSQLTKLFVAARSSLEHYPIPQLPLELLVVDYCVAAAKSEMMPMAQKIVARVEQKNSSLAITSISHSLDLNQVLQRWTEVIAAVQPLNYSLCGFLKLCRPVAFKNGSLVLGFPRDFHKNIVAQNDNRKIVERVLDNVLGGKWRIQCEKVDAAAANHHLTREVLDVLGGEIVK